MRVAIYDPDVVFGQERPAGRNAMHTWHNYARAFIMKYGECILVRREKDVERYKKFAEKYMINYNGLISLNAEVINKNADIMVGFTRHPEDDGTLLSQFYGVKFFHTMDYNYKPVEYSLFYKKAGINYLIGHTQLDKYCPFFREFYPEYIGRVIGMPFGYYNKFKNNKDWNSRINKAIGLGAIHSLTKDESRESKFWSELFPDAVCDHPIRSHIRDNIQLYEGLIDAFYPLKSDGSAFDYDSVEMLNSYKMFINDEGLNNFPPARTFEGIACGCVMVASKNPIYEDLGFISDVNYIGFEKGDYEEMKFKLEKYTKDSSLLDDIHNKSIELSKRFTHELVADGLLEDILERLHSQENSNWKI